MRYNAHSIILKRDRHHNASSDIAFPIVLALQHNKENPFPPEGFFEVLYL
jgi:hypothetical protein